MTSKQDTLPVIIIGSGPCGVVAATILTKHKIPFVIVERATREKICSNAGSGFELQRTAVRILKEELGMDPSAVDKIMHVYAGSYSVCLEDNSFLRDMDLMPEGNDAWHVATVNRADLQNMLLQNLFPTPDDEVGALKCGVSFDSYVEDTAKGEVTVTLSDASTIKGRLLLGCDGINSKVRQCLHGGDKVDPLHFLDVKFYWGKCPIVPGSDLEKEVNKTQTYLDNKGTSMVSRCGSRKAPGNLYLCQSEADSQRWMIWALSFPAEEAPKLTGDNTRRGGRILTDADKELLKKRVETYKMPLLHQVLQSTEASQISEAGLFDRQNLDLPYSSPGGLVALLGDAAHPQSPVLGQGANMAITDAYVVATRLVHQTNADIPTIIKQHYDTEARRSSVNTVIQQARSATKYFITTSWLMNWLFRAFVKWIPIGMFISEGVGLDKSNGDFVQQLRDDLNLAPTKE